MLPVIASMVVGGASAMMHQQGMGGMLGQLAQGGLGSILGQFGGAGGTAGGLGGSQAPGGLPGMLGTIFNSFFGGGAAPQGPQAGQTHPGQARQRASDHAGALPTPMQAGMDSLFKMFQPGVAGQGAQPGNLADMIGAALGRR